MRFDTSPTKNVSHSIFLQALSRLASPQKPSVRRPPYVPAIYFSDSDHKEEDITKNPFAVIHSQPSSLNTRSPFEPRRNQARSENDDDNLEPSSTEVEDPFQLLPLGISPIRFGFGDNEEAEVNRNLNWVVTSPPSPPRVYEVPSAGASSSTFFTARLDPAEESPRTLSGRVPPSPISSVPHLVHGSPRKRRLESRQRASPQVTAHSPLDGGGVADGAIERKTTKGVEVGLPMGRVRGFWARLRLGSWRIQ